MARTPAPAIGKHLATLNLFREPNGTVEITVADAQGAMAELALSDLFIPLRPIDYAEGLVLEAAGNMRERILNPETNARQTHELKVHPQFWQSLKCNAKPFEVRRNDRSFKVGDKLVLRLFDPTYGFVASEPALERRVTFILWHEDFPNGVPVGYVVLGFGFDTANDGK